MVLSCSRLVVTGLDGNVGKFVIGIQSGLNVHTTTYDFEPATTSAPYVPVAGDIVINEIMWMGSDPAEGGSIADEWIELRNTTSEDIDLSGWTIENLGTNDNPTITIPSGTITAGGYFLIANYPSTHPSSAISDFIAVDFASTSVNLNNGGEQLTLRDAGNNIIDQTPTGSWAAGNNTAGLYQSMERNHVPGDGTLITSWHTCIDSGCTSTAFWDISGDNYGTPRALNLSQNDPTSLEYVAQDWSHTIGSVADDNDEMDDSEIITEDSFAPTIETAEGDEKDKTAEGVGGAGGGGGDALGEPTDETDDVNPEGTETKPATDEDVDTDEPVEEKEQGVDEGGLNSSNEEKKDEEVEVLDPDDGNGDAPVEELQTEETPAPEPEVVPEPEPEPIPEPEPVPEVVTETE